MLDFATLARLSSTSTSPQDLTLQLQAVAIAMTALNQIATRISQQRPPGPIITPAETAAWQTIATQATAINATATPYLPGATGGGSPTGG